MDKKHYWVQDLDKGLYYRFKGMLGRGSIYSFDVFRYGDMDEGEPELVPYEEYSEADFVINEVKRLTGSESLLTALRLKEDTKDAIENDEVFGKDNLGVEYIERDRDYRIYKIDKPSDTVRYMSDLGNIAMLHYIDAPALFGSVEYDKNGDRYFVPEGETEPYYDLDYFGKEEQQGSDLPRPEKTGKIEKDGPEVENDDKDIS